MFARTLLLAISWSSLQAAGRMFWVVTPSGKPDEPVYVMTAGKDARLQEAKHPGASSVRALDGAFIFEGMTMAQLAERLSTLGLHRAAGY